ncbi:MAG: glycine-rich domain-containing protein-like [Patescibacteria group bacterium]|nr:glycine-rich domain-containing protein-like [Patescibacteria group bacterium]
MGLDLDPVKIKIMDPEEGKGWSKAHADKVEQEYKQFLVLTQSYPDKAIVPTKDVDALWHQHILDTMKYAQDCDEIFGKFLHHFPYFGMRGEDDAQQLVASAEETRALYKSDFGVDIALTASECSSCGASSCAASSCGSSCSGYSPDYDDTDSIMKTNIRPSFQTTHQHLTAAAS